MSASQGAVTRTSLALLLAFAAVVLLSIDVPGPVRAVVVVTALLTAPGLALMPRPGTGDPWARAGMTVALSVVVGVLVALASVWAQWWHPRLVGAALLLVACGVLVARRRAGSWPWWRLRGPGAAAAVTETGHRWVALLDDGREVPLTGTVPVGRLPSRSNDGATRLTGAPVTPLMIDDATKSVSRGHLRLQVEGDILVVVDQESVNGTTVTTSAGEVTRCPPHQPVPVHDGDIVSFGDHWLTARHRPGTGVATGIGPDAHRTDPAPPGRVLSGLRRPSSWVPAGVLVLALLAWVIALSHTSTSALGVWGLLPVFPWLWYAGVAVVLVVLALGVVGRRAVPSAWMAAYCAVLVLMLYGSATFVASEPRLPWIYKHIAVTRYIELYGSVDPSVDLYHRWPGFFAWTALLAEVSGQHDPIVWAGLAEPFFALLDALLVLGVARHLSRNPRFSWLATLLFCLGNWVNQNYFAPQALAYCLYLFIVLLLVATARAQPRRLGQLVERLVLRVVRPRSGRLAVSLPPERPEGPDQPGPAAARQRRWALAAVVAAFAVIVASHQLTPYLTLLVLAPLLLLGFLRPAWLTAVMVAIAVGYLIPNLPYIQSKFGLFSGFDPVANAVYSSIDRTTLPAGERWSARTSYLLSGILYFTAVVGIVRRARAGSVRSAVLVAWMTLAPALILAVQSYGGEGRLRVYLFSLPWCVMAAAWAFFPAAEAARRSVRTVLALLLSVLASLFTVAYFAPEAAVQVPASDIAAAQWMDEHARPGDVLLAVTPIFPSLIGPHYEDLVPDAEISRYVVFYPKLLTRADVIQIGSGLVKASGPDRLLIVFSDHQATYAERHQLYRPGELAELETLISGAPSDRRIFSNSSVRIYEVG